VWYLLYIVRLCRNIRLVKKEAWKKLSSR